MKSEFAFPMQETENYNHNPGMTLRDYFAAKAMQAIIESNFEDWNDLSRMAYEAADAMLKERDK